MLINTLQAAFLGGELSPALFGRVDFYKYAIGAKKLTNFIVRPFGGISNRGGLQFIGTIKDTEYARLIPFSYSLDQQYILEFGTEYIRFWQLNLDGSVGLVMKGDVPYEESTPYDGKDLKEVTFSQLGNALFLAHRNYPPKKLIRHAADLWTLSDLNFNPRINAPVLNSVALVGDHSSSVTYHWKYCITAVNEDGEESTASNEIGVNGHPELTTARYIRLGFSLTSHPKALFDYIDWGNYTVNQNNKGFILGTELWIDGVLKSQYTNSQYGDTKENFITRINSLQLGILASSSGETGICLEYTEGASFNGHSVQIIILTTQKSRSYSAVFSGGIDETSDTQVAKYNIYRYTAGVYSWIGETKDTTFDDVGYSAFSEQNPPKLFSYFSDVNNYPGSVAVFQQRLCFGGTINDPGRLWLSRLGQYENFSTDDNLTDASAIDVKIYSGRALTDIRHLLAGKDLTILCRDSEWALSGDGAVTPLSLDVSLQNKRGANYVTPVGIDSYVVYVGADGQSVRDLSYSLNDNGYIGNDLTLLSKHFFDGFSIIAASFQQNPNNLLWLIRNDGKLLSLTYMKEQDIYAWSSHETQGAFKDVITLETATKDRLFFIIERNGTLFLEEMHNPISLNETIEDAFYVDCGLQKIFNTAIEEVSGLEHLNEKTVSCLLDGHAFLGLQIKNGFLKLPIKAKNIVVGLPYEATFQSVDMQVALQNGSSYGRHRGISRFIIYLEQSRGLFYGTSLDNLFEAKERTTENYDTPTMLQAGFKELQVGSGYHKELNLFLLSKYPLPLNIMNFIAEVDYAA